jgi:hypothetical protein
MNEYRVVYVMVEDGASRAQIAERMQHECTRSAREGWRFVTAVADTDRGTTKGIFLFFASDEAESVDAAQTVALAQELMGERPRED